MSNNKSDTFGKAINDPALYRRMSEPVDSVETATHRFNEFFEDLRKLREKYHISDLAIGYGMNAKDKDGKEIFVVSTGYCGGPRAERLILELTQQTRFGMTMLALVDELALAAFKA